MTMPIRIDIDAAIERIGAARRIVITTHARADGDAIGCVAGMRRVLRQQGKSAEAYVHEPVPERYAFLTAADPLSVWRPAAAAGVLASCDLLLVLDTCAAVQLGDIADAIRAAAADKLAIDHHVTRDDIVAAAWVDTSAGACAQLVLRLCDRAGWHVDADTATLLFAGLATDTGWFRFSNADSAAFEDAARLISAGARPSALYEALFLQEILPRVRLMGEVMRSFELRADGRVAVVRVTREMLARCGATREMTEDIINEPMRVASVVACVMLTEPDGDAPVRASFRSKRDLDVARLAARWGGGGHSRAAGAKIVGPFVAVAEDVAAALVDSLEPAAAASPPGGGSGSG